MTPVPHYTPVPGGYAYTGLEGAGVVLTTVAFAYEAHSGRVLMHGRPERVREWAARTAEALETARVFQLEVRVFKFPAGTPEGEINRSLWNPYHFRWFLGREGERAPIRPCPEEFLA